MVECDTESVHRDSELVFSGISRSNLVKALAIVNNLVAKGYRVKTYTQTANYGLHTWLLEWRHL